MWHVTKRDAEIQSDDFVVEKRVTHRTCSLDTCCPVSFSESVVSSEATFTSITLFNFAHVSHIDLTDAKLLLSGSRCYWCKVVFVLATVSSTASDSTGISSRLASAEGRFVLRLVQHTVWGELSKNMKLSKWPFPWTRRDGSNWHILMLSTEANRDVLLCNAKLPFHKRWSQYPWNVWFKMTYNTVSFSSSIHVMSRR